MSSDFLHFAQVEKSQVYLATASSQCPHLSSSNPILFCRILGCVPHPKPSPFLASRPASSKRARNFAGRGSRSLPGHLNCGHRGEPLECTEVCPNRPAFNKWTCGVWSEEKSHLLTFLPGFLATAEGELPPWTEQTQEREPSCERHTPQKITGGTHGYTLTHRHRERARTRARTHAQTHTLPALVVSLHSRPPPPFLSPPCVPSSRAPGKTAALSQQMARGRSW